MECGFVIAIDLGWIAIMTFSHQPSYRLFRRLDKESHQASVPPSIVVMNLMDAVLVLIVVMRFPTASCFTSVTSLLHTMSCFRYHSEK